MVVSDVNILGNMKIFILTTKNQIYSRCIFVTEIEFTVSMLGLPNTVEAAYYNRGCYPSAIIKISGPKTLHLKSFKNKPFIVINISVIVIKLQIIRVHI